MSKPISTALVTTEGIDLGATKLSFVGEIQSRGSMAEPEFISLIERLHVIVAPYPALDSPPEVHVQGSGTALSFALDANGLYCYEIGDHVDASAVFALLATPDESSSGSSLSRMSASPGAMRTAPGWMVTALVLLFGGSGGVYLLREGSMPIMQVLGGFVVLWSLLLAKVLRAWISK